MYRKAINLRDGNSSGTNGNVLLRDGSTDPLAMNPHTISADEVQPPTFKLYYWNAYGLVFFFTLPYCNFPIRIEVDEKLSNKWTIKISMDSKCYFSTKRNKTLLVTLNWDRKKKTRLQTNLTKLVIGATDHFNFGCIQQ